MPSVAILAVLPPLGALLCVALFLRRRRRLRALQAEAVRQAAAAAREQFGRDVHDLVSSRLWLATLKSEIAYRLADEDSPVRPALADVVQSIRQAATDIRNVTRSYQEISLPSELANARAVLRAYGTDCKVELTDTYLEPDVSAVLAVMVREAVTNVLRHSRARLCVIEVAADGDNVLLMVANDGVEPASPPCPGSGIDNLRSRAAALGGIVGTIVDPDGWFRLFAEIPNHHPQ
ncbi:sensor histidine kinase [Microbispora sp. NPDC049125]|uniref:sensor histidine kinase n=1 Tax=Microbispora sp. NPDC049125 TaxID=3154929 RepID=UPI003467C0B0